MGLKAVAASVTALVAAVAVGFIAPSSAVGATAAPPVRARVSDLPRAPFFGAFAAGAPADPTQLNLIARETGTAPSVVETFQQLTASFSVSRLRQSNWRGAVPLVTVETWAGVGGGVRGVESDQPAYANSQIIRGRYDRYLRVIARSIVQYRKPVILRLDHEMNGNWYAWSDGVNGNARGSYVQMWRHVFGVFRRAGAANVLWLWAPNIVRGTDGSSARLRSMYPGDAYVNLVGLSGYGVYNATPAQTFDPSLKVLAGITGRPVVLAETGAEVDPWKTGWIKAFGPYLHAHRHIVGFVWYNLRQSQNWRFDDSPADLAAFRRTLAAR